MTPRLWEDVLELQKQAKLKDNVIFSAQKENVSKNVILNVILTVILSVILTRLSIRQIK